MVADKLISIIIPIYNCEQYLEECLESVANQTYRNIEIILINDGSVDSSKSICRSFCERDERVVYIEQENKGVSAARNAGMKVARGEYLMFVDADDIISQQICQGACNEILGFDILFFDIVPFKTKSEIPDMSLVIEKAKSINLCSKGQPEWIKNALNEHQTIGGYRLNLSPACGTLYRKGFIVEHNLEFCLGIPFGEDMLFNLKVYASNPKACYLPVPAYFYRYNQKSAVHRYTPDYDRWNQSLYLELETFLMANRVLEKTYQELKFQKMNGLIISLSRDIFHPNNPKEESRKRRDFLELIDRYQHQLSERRNAIKMSAKNEIILWLARHRQYTLLKLAYMFKGWMSKR